MTVHQRTHAYVTKFFKTYRLPEHYRWTVLTSGNTDWRQILIIHGLEENPRRLRDAKIAGNLIYVLPGCPGKNSKKLYEACMRVYVDSIFDFVYISKEVEAITHLRELAAQGKQDV